MIEAAPHRLIEERADELAQWLEDEAPYIKFDQGHLDAGTPAQAYWHLGYQTALGDVLRMLKDEAARSDGTSSRSPAGDSDA